MESPDSANDAACWDGGFRLLAVTAVPLMAVVVASPAASTITTAAQLASAVAGACVLIAAVLFYLQWRVRPVSRQGWLVAATVLLAHQLLVSSVLAFATSSTDHDWPLALDTVTTVLALGIVAVVLRQDTLRCPDPLALGLGTGTALAAARLVPPQVGLSIDVPVVVLCCVIVLGHLALAAVALQYSQLPRWVARRLALTIVLVAGANVALPVVAGGSEIDLLASSLCAGAAVVWASATFVQLRRTVERRHRRTADLEGDLLLAEDTQRTTREQLHELRSTVAGLASASRLVADPRVEDEARRRLLRTMRAELERMERLLSPERAPSSASADVGAVDVDESLDSVLALHRARGRQVRWTPTGARIVGRQDALKEAVNILLDNAAVHGSPDGARVDVADSGDMVQISVTDDGPGVPAHLRQRIFDWGAQRPDSPGQGIGLSVAQRLVSEQGGSLSLSSPGAGGSSFIIRLPRVRQSEEYDRVRTEQQPG